MCRYWCLRDDRFEHVAYGTIEKMRCSRKGDKCFSSFFEGSCNVETLQLNHNRSTADVSGFIPMMLMIAQSAWDNCDRANLEVNSILKGGGMNGRAPNAPTTTGEDGKKVTTPTMKTLNCYLFTSSIEGMPQSGCQILYDNQAQPQATVKRRGTTPGLPGVPINPLFVAHILFKPLNENDSNADIYEYRNAFDKILVAKNASKLPPDFDLCSVTYEDTPTQPPLENITEKSTQTRVKPEPIIAQLITISQHVCDLQNALNEFRPSTLEVAENASAENDNAVSEERNNSDDENHDGHEDDVTTDNSNSVTFKSTVEDELKEMEKCVLAMASYTKMSGTTSCRSILIHQRYNDIKELGANVLASTINRYLTLAVQHPQSPVMIKDYAELRRGDLKLIVENFGVKYSSGMMTQIQEGNYLTDPELEDGLVSVKFKGRIRSQGITVRDMRDPTDDLEINNILHAQEAWIRNDWVSNIGHMKLQGCGDEDFRKISMILWVKRETVYVNLKKLFYEGVTSDSEEEFD